MDTKQHVNHAEPVGVRARPADHSADDALTQQLTGAVTAARGHGQLRSADVLALQRVAGNQVVQRLVAKLIDGLAVDTPSTYDTGGGHSYADHGAQTTEVQQRTRLRTGVAPSGRSSPVPQGSGASKFASDAKHAEAMKAASKELTDKNKNKKKGKGITGPMPLAAAGPIYLRDGTSVTGTNVQVDLAKVAGTEDTFHLNTMFPMP
jgi:hypothetical protein